MHHSMHSGHVLLRDARASKNLLKTGLSHPGKSNRMETGSLLRKKKMKIMKNSRNILKPHISGAEHYTKISH
jgi:hypothetical protein